MRKLIELMESKGYTDLTLAQKLDINKSYISLLRSGKRNPSPVFIKKIKAQFKEYAEIVALADAVFMGLVS